MHPTAQERRLRKSIERRSSLVSARSSISDLSNKSGVSTPRVKMLRKEPVPVFSRRAPKKHDEAEISSDEEIKMHRVS